MRHSELYAIALALATTFAARADIPTDDLRLWLPFKGNAVDESGYGHTAIISGATPTLDRFGNVESAFHFDGIDDFIDVEASADLQAQLPVTLAAWIKRSPSAGTAPIFSNNFTDDFYSGVWIGSSSGKFAASFGDGGSRSTLNRRSKLADSGFQPDVWYHVTAVVRSAEDMTLYVNGNDICGAYSGTGDDLSYTGSNASIGINNFAGPSIFYSGDLDDIALYGRALNGAEVLQLGGFADDVDGDGVANAADNCTQAANPSQADADADGFGNACDADLNNDSIVNAADLGLLRSAFFSTTGSATWSASADFNDDGAVNSIDLGIMKTGFMCAPGPSANR